MGIQRIRDIAASVGSAPRWSILLLVLAWALGCAPAKPPHLGPGPAPTNPVDRALEQLVDRYLFDAFSIDPVDGSFRGDDRFARLWPSTSTAALGEDRLILQGYRTELAEIDRAALSANFARDATLMELHLEQSLDRLDARASHDAELAAKTIFVGLASLVVDGTDPAALRARADALSVPGPLKLTSPIGKLRAKADLALARAILERHGLQPQTRALDEMARSIDAMAPSAQSWPKRDKERFLQVVRIPRKDIPAEVDGALSVLAAAKKQAERAAPNAPAGLFDQEVSRIAGLCERRLLSPRVEALRPQPTDADAVSVEAEAIRFVFGRLLRTANRELLASKAKRHLRPSSFDDAWVAMGARFLQVLGDEAAPVDLGIVASFEETRLLVGALIDAGLHFSSMDDWTFNEWIVALSERSHLPQAAVASELELAERSPGFAFRRYLDYTALKARLSGPDAKTDPPVILRLVSSAGGSRLER